MQYVPTHGEVFKNSLCDKDARVWVKYFVFNTYPLGVTMEQTRDPDWQTTRCLMLKTPRRFKWNTLRRYLCDHRYSLHAQCVVTNYVHVLKRGGIII
jgi:hypothetical protein